MKIETAKIAPEWNHLFVDFDNGKKLMVNIPSMGGKSYHIGEEVHGYIMDGAFNICREYYSSKKEKWFGFISRDKIIEDFVRITVIDNNEIGETVRVKRKDIVNY